LRRATSSDLSFPSGAISLAQEDEWRRPRDAAANVIQGPRTSILAPAPSEAARLTFLPNRDACRYVGSQTALHRSAHLFVTFDVPGIAKIHEFRLRKQDHGLAAQTDQGCKIYGTEKPANSGTTPSSTHLSDDSPNRLCQLASYPFRRAHYILPPAETSSPNQRSVHEAQADTTKTTHKPPHRSKGQAGGLNGR